MSTHEQGDHSLGVHALSDVELVVLEAADDLLGKVLCALLESRDSLRVGLGELGLNGLHVALEVGEVGLTLAKFTSKWESYTPSCRKRWVGDGTSG